MQAIEDDEASSSHAVLLKRCHRIGVRAIFTLTMMMVPGCPDFFPLPVPCVTSEECLDRAARPVCVDGRCVECAGASDCDDTDACTTDACNADHECAHAAVSCDDDDACTVDSCEPASGCAATPVECVDGGVCVDGECVCACATNADCADDNRCTIVACVDCLCQTTAVSCDDGDPCTTDSCDPVNGCMSSTTVCDDGDSCTVDECDPLVGCIATPIECPDGDDCVDGACFDDECVGIDCDDGVFCNGREVCLDGACKPGPDPCPADSGCDEANNDCGQTAGCLGGGGDGFRLTFTADSFTSGSCSDRFTGSLEVIGGTIYQTLNNTDMLRGGDGSDTVTAQLRGGGTTTPALLESIEIINLEVTDTKSTTVDLRNSTGVATVNNSNSLAALTVSDVPTKLTDAKMSNGGADFTVLFPSNAALAPLAGSSDALTLTLSGVTDTGATPVITIGPAVAGSGYKTLNIVSAGSTANSIQHITQGLGNSLGTVSVSGSRSLVIDAALDSTVVFFDASTSGGGVNVHLSSSDTTAYGSDASDVLIGGPGADQIDGRSGDDLLTGGGGADAFIGGAGADVFVLDQGATLGDLLASRNTINDFVAGADKLRANNAGGTVNVGVLTGSDAFATSAAIQDVSTSGNLTVNGAARLVRITVEAAASCSTDGASVLDAIVNGTGTSGAITAPANGVALFSVYTGTNTCLYIGAADTTGGGNTDMVATEFALVATFWNLDHANWTFGDFLP